MFFNSQNIPGGAGHSADTLRGQRTQRKVQERVEASRSSDVWESSEASSLPISFVGLTKIFSERTAEAIKHNAFVDYSDHLVWLGVTRGKGRYPVDRKYTFFEFLPANVDELVVEDGDLEVYVAVSLTGL